jgi:phosphoglycolate phosphatase-like HAD superfamily hydrolase
LNSDPQQLILFVFDLDGTLADFAVDWGDVRKRLRRLLATEEPLTPLLPSLEALVLDPALKRRAYELIDAVELTSAQTFDRDDELVRLFSRLKARGRKIALVTLQGRPAAEEALARLGIRRYVDLIISRDECTVREEQIARSLTILGVPPSRSVVIADREADMAAARRLGCVAVAVGVRPGLSGDFRAKSSADILKVLGMEDE